MKCHKITNTSPRQPIIFNAMCMSVIPPSLLILVIIIPPWHVPTCQRWLSDRKPNPPRRMTRLQRRVSIKLLGPDIHYETRPTLSGLSPILNINTPEWCHGGDLTHGEADPGVDPERKQTRRGISRVAPIF